MRTTQKPDTILFSYLHKGHPVQWKHSLSSPFSLFICLVVIVWSFMMSFLPICRHNRLESGLTGLMFSIESHNETLSHNSTSMHFHWLIHVLENKVQNLGKSSFVLFSFVFFFQTTFINQWNSLGKFYVLNIYLGFCKLLRDLSNRCSIL